VILAFENSKGISLAGVVIAACSKSKAAAALPPEFLLILSWPFRTQASGQPPRNR
jgi:hypothetical protein